MKKNLKKTFFALLAGFLLSSSVYAQDITVKGHVKEAKTGEAVIGANIIVKGTSIGTISDVDGNFTLNAPQQSTITVSFLGFKQKEFKATTNSVTIALEEDSRLLSEVVVIGYGSQTKKELTGSIASVKPSDFNKGSIPSVQGLLQGKVAGLNITKDAGGDPTNKEYNVQLRGVATLTLNASPLFIIDGVPGGNFGSVAPSDIESIDVLKDGSAAAIYGTRANAGVIIITTKKGKYGVTGQAQKAQIEYSGMVQTDMIAKRIEMLSASEYRDFINNPKYLDAKGNKPGSDLGANTDWQKEITRPIAVSHTHNVALSGAGANYHFRSSINYKDLQGLAKTSGYDDLLLRASASVKGLNNMLEISPDISFSTSNTHWVDHLIFREALNMNPTAPVYDATNDTYGGYYTPDGFSTYNPVAIINQRIDEGRQSAFQGGVRAELTIIPQLKLSTFLSRLEDKNLTGKYVNRFSKFEEGASKEGVARRFTSLYKTDLIENMINYLEDFNQHRVQAMLGNSYQYFSYEDLSAENRGFEMDDFTFNKLQFGADLKDGKASIESSKKSSKLASYFARLLYNYNQRYFLSTSIRLEGSSKFGEKAHPTLGCYGIFPSVSGSWIISDESFMANVKFVNHLKLRAGYGVTGNMPDDRNINRYIELVAPNTGEAYYIDGKFKNPWRIIQNHNPYLKWEEKHEYNIGLDFVLLQSKLSGTIDAYLRDTKDLLYDARVKMPPYSIEWMLANYGQIQNKGIELTLNYAILKSKDYTFNAGLTLATNTNKLVNLTYTGLGADESPTFRDIPAENANWRGTTGLTFTRIEIGKPLGRFYGYQFSHIDQATGRPMYYKLQDGRKTQNPDGTMRTTASPIGSDKTYLGSAYPLLTGGFNLSATYKQWDATANFRGQIGGKIMNVKRIYFEDKASGQNVMQSAFEGEMALVKGGQLKMSDYYLEDASFLKLNDLTLGYTLPLNETGKKYLSNARVSFTCQNAFTITTYTGMDPEVSLAGLTPGVDGINYYPKQRTFLLGLNVSF